MQLQKMSCLVAFFMAAIVLFSCQTTIGQSHQRAPAVQGGQSATQQMAQKNDKPYSLSSRFHLQQGSNTGYLVVHVKLPEGSYIYSLSQKAPLFPTKITVAKSAQFQLKTGFSPDRAAIVVEKDPLFGERVEKHKNEVQFFANIEVAPGTDVAALEADLTFDGQVCSEQGFCLPISAVKLKGKFAGYFERTAEKTDNN